MRRPSVRLAYAIVTSELLPRVRRKLAPHTLKPLETVVVAVVLVLVVVVASVVVEEEVEVLVEERARGHAIRSMSMSTTVLGLRGQVALETVSLDGAHADAEQRFLKTFRLIRS